MDDVRGDVHDHHAAQHQLQQSKMKSQRAGEGILQRFQVIQRTQFSDRQTSKGNNSKIINANVMVLALCFYC